MKESSSSSSIRLGGAVISDRVVAAILEDCAPAGTPVATRRPAGAGGRAMSRPSRRAAPVTSTGGGGWAASGDAVADAFTDNRRGANE